MRIAVIGVGAVGGYFGGCLARTGEEVFFIARGAHLAALRQQGLRIDSPKGDFVVHPVQATEDASEVGTVDAVVVGVKAWQVSEAARAIRPMVGPETVVVPLQNGVEAPARLTEVLGEGPALGGTCRIISRLAAPGHVIHIGAEPDVAFGELDNRPNEQARRLRAVFEQAGVKAEIPADIQVAMWKKFVFICSISGVGAVTRVPFGILRSLPQTRRMLEQAMQEIEAVARARNIRLPSNVTPETLAFIDQLPPDGTASMQRDIMAGRPSELETQNGAVVRLGRMAEVAVPLHTFIYHSLLPQEQQARR